MYTLTAIVDRFEKGRAVLTFDDGQTLILAKRLLPVRVKEGGVVKIELYRDEDSQVRQTAIARYILKEVLEPNETKNRPLGP